MRKKSSQTLLSVGIAFVLLAGMFGVLLFGESSKWNMLEKAEQAITSKAKTNLIAYIRENMNDPESFKLVAFNRTEDKAVIKYRGKNAFNAVVLNVTTAQIDDKGNLLNIETE